MDRSIDFSQMKNRIFFSVTNDLTYDQRMIRICGSLAAAGYSVRLIGRKQSNSLSLVQREFQQVRLPCWFQKGICFYAEYNIRLFFYLLFHTADIYCAIDLDTILPNLLISRLKGKQRVYDAHEYFTEVPEVVRRPRVKRFWDKIAHWSIPQFEHCYTVASGLGRLMTTAYGPVFQVIRNVPIPSKNVARPALDQPFTLLYQGVLNEGRGLEVAIKAMKELSNAQLWLAGEGDLSAALRSLAKQENVEDQVHFLGYIRPTALKKITLQAHLGLNILENKGLSYYYSLANKAFDYIQAGLPSVHMNFPAYLELQNQYDVFQLLEELSVEALVSGIKYLQEDKARYQQLQENCLAARSKLNWEQEEKILLSFYQNLLHTNH